MTAHLSKVTKDELVQQRDEIAQELERHRSADQRRDADARAIDACVKALDALSDASRSGRSNTINSGSSYFEPGPRTPVERVLGYLRQRYGIADPAGERDALRAELERTQRELESLRRRFSQVYEAVQS